MVRAGGPVRAAARRWRLAYATAWMWVKRARGKRLERVDFEDRPAGCRVAPNRASDRTQRRVIRLRRELKQTSVLGEYGAAAIRREMTARNLRPVPSVRTIGRILSRTGQLDGRARVRRSPPPPGWYIPMVAKGLAELDSFDGVEGLKIKDGPIVETLNGVSLHGKLVASWPTGLVTAKFTVLCLIRHWKCFGLPGYAQFDNGSVFLGNPRFPDGLGRVVRLCLPLGVTPVFAPPREHGVQNMTESYNNLWQSKVWRRYEHRSLEDLTTRSDAYVLERRRRTAPAYDAAPRRPFPPGWSLDLNAPLTGRVIFIRRTSEAGGVVVLKRAYAVDRDWPHRLVRAELDLDADKIHFYRLRKRDPEDQPLICSADYRFPRRRFSP
jgi:hypothetical protein